MLSLFIGLSSLTNRTSVSHAQAFVFSASAEPTFLDNAYVSGLKEELGFEGNQLVHLQTIYILGAVLGQLPFCFLFTRVPMQWLIPGLDFGWGIFTLLQYRVESYAELMAYRFMVGWFEVQLEPFVPKPH